MLNNRINISTPLIASLIALGLGGLIVLVYFFGVVIALFGPGTGDVEPDAKLAQYVSDHEKELETYEKSFNGRSVFYIPPARRPPAPQITTVEKTPEEYVPPTPPQPKDPIYNGPSPAWAIGSEVWFHATAPGKPMSRLRVGEEVDGIKLVSVNLPQEIVVRQHDKDFTLQMLKSFPWEQNADRVLGSEPLAPRNANLPGLKVVSGDNQPNGAETAGTQLTTTMDDVELEGPPVPEDLVDVVIMPEPEPEPEPHAIPQVHVQPSNDDADPEAVPVGSQEPAGSIGGAGVDNEAENAAQNEAGDYVEDDEMPTPELPRVDPDNPGPPPE